MTRSRKQKAAARNHSVAESTSYVNAFYQTKSPFTGKFAKTLEIADKHGNWYYSHNPTGVLSEWEKTTEYCLDDCNCAEKLEPERQRFWKDVFSFLPADQVPFLAGTEFVVPTYTAWLRDRQPDDDAPYTPIIFATFSYPDDLGYSDFIGMKSNVMMALGEPHIAILPVGTIGSNDVEQLGSIGEKGFRVALMEISSIDHFSHGEHQLSFSAMELFDSKLWSIQRAVRFESKMLTAPFSTGQIKEIKFAADNSSDMKRIADILRDRTGAKWVSIMEEYHHDFEGIHDMEQRRIYAAHLSNNESTRFTAPEYKFPVPVTAMVRKLNFSTSGEKRNRYGNPSVFSGGDIEPVGFSESVVQRDDDGIITGFKEVSSV